MKRKCIQIVTVKGGDIFDVVEVFYNLRKDGRPNSKVQFWLDKAMNEGDEVKTHIFERKYDTRGNYVPPVA